MLKFVCHSGLFHNLADIGHASAAFGVGLPASTVPYLLFSHDFLHDQGATVMRFNIIHNIFICVGKTITYNLLHFLVSHGWVKFFG
ncbi:MAG: hypothetical protein FD168_1641 [Desulfobulbaceae bacterium]|nr:MAG: hypothetical protein FD168_1641 [Desulfobulbaceae bacterium]